MSVLPKILLAWHTVRTHYHEALLEGCLDSKLKRNIDNKLKYHRSKMKELSTPL